MKTMRMWFLAAACFTLVACGLENIESIDDDGNVVTDGGQTATDGGGTVTDAGPATDGGQTQTDGGAPSFSRFCKDADADGARDPEQCLDAAAQPAGYLPVSAPIDCDDNRSAVKPGVSEVPNNGIDDNCDGSVDETNVPPVCTVGATRSCYSGPSATRGVGRCRDGLQTCITSSSGPAWDVSCVGEITPWPFDGGEIAGNNVDDDCDGSVDEAPPQTKICYRDVDGDTYGHPTDTQTVAATASCPTGYVERDLDCDDSRADVNPGRTEIQGNNLDDDCSSLTADGSAPVDWSQYIRIEGTKVCLSATGMLSNPWASSPAYVVGHAPLIWNLESRYEVTPSGGFFCLDTANTSLYPRGNTFVFSLVSKVRADGSTISSLSEGRWWANSELCTSRSQTARNWCVWQSRSAAGYDNYLVAFQVTSSGSVLPAGDQR
jgi:hypothetical protein